ncbi:hypothetical protein QQ045_018526 [Rhodiola kirilowii]
MRIHIIYHQTRFVHWRKGKRRANMRRKLKPKPAERCMNNQIHWSKMNLLACGRIEDNNIPQESPKETCTVDGNVISDILFRENYKFITRTITQFQNKYRTIKFFESSIEGPN